MTLQADILLKIGAGMALLIAAAPPAAAWEEQGNALRSLPSGGLMLKEAPGTDPKLQNLPGVRLNPQALNSGSGNCTQRQVSGYRFGESGTVNECNFGNFSVSTYNSGSGSSGAAYNPFPVPSPLQQAGPPPGSGGFAPRQRSIFD